ncbi:hypothetical protein BRADI_1g00253v3 [Brachypodium distachyon]|uniref:Uncharacterized protein n=1 Tax=Brachypodium distachyon TaxID=15368 RepID=A0A0Q3GLB2_BRADI|nr:hypothetical protein BRADI_1g00253v3 [Brachypodium distachyon]
MQTSTQPCTSCLHRHFVKHLAYTGRRCASRSASPVPRTMYQSTVDRKKIMDNLASPDAVYTLQAPHRPPPRRTATPAGAAPPPPLDFCAAAGASSTLHCSQLMLAPLCRLLLTPLPLQRRHATPPLPRLLHATSPHAQPHRWRAGESRQGESWEGIGAARGLGEGLRSGAARRDRGQHSKRSVSKSQSAAA